MFPTNLMLSKAWTKVIIHVTPKLYQTFKRPMFEMEIMYR